MPNRDETSKALQCLPLHGLIRASMTPRTNFAVTEEPRKFNSPQYKRRPRSPATQPRMEFIYPGEAAQRFKMSGGDNQNFRWAVS